MTTQLRRDRQKGRVARPDGTFAVNTHAPHVKDVRCPQCRPVGLTDDQRALMATQQRTPFRQPAMQLETIFDRLDGTKQRPFSVSDNVRAALDKSLGRVFASRMRARTGRSSRQRSE